MRRTKRKLHNVQEKTCATLHSVQCEGMNYNASVSRDEILRARRERDLNPPAPFSDKLRALAKDLGITPQQLGSEILAMDLPNTPDHQ